VPIESI